MNHRQCLLVKNKQSKVIWIPQEKAIAGKYLKLLDEDGWLVKEVYKTLSSKEANLNSQDFKHQREMSDI